MAKAWIVAESFGNTSKAISKLFTHLAGSLAGRIDVQLMYFHLGGVLSSQGHLETVFGRPEKVFCGVEPTFEAVSYGNVPKKV